LTLLALGMLLLGTAASAGSAAKPTFNVSGAPKLTSAFSAPKSASGALARTDPSLLGQTGSKPVDVMIKYDVDATASYAGGVAGFAPTSPSVTGKSLDQNAVAVSAYSQHLNQVAGRISAAIDKAVPDATIRQTYTTAYGGVEAQVPANQIGTLLTVPGVVAVQKDALEQPLDDNTGFIGASAVWPQLGGASKAGSNVIVGVLDTGVWPENPMLSPAGVGPTPAGGPWQCDFGDGSDVAHLGPVFHCNNKLIGAYSFTQTYMAVNGSDGQEFCNNTTGICSARDPEGHGTHTMTTAAGDCVSSAVLYGVDRGPVCGIAPGAHVIEYRVCLSLGCFNSDSVNAVEQAILDGVNVINFSISGGADPYTDPVELAFLDAFHAGISVNAAAGNDGPTPGTVDHGGPWVTSVGAVTGPRSFSSTLHLTAGGGATYSQSGVTLTNGITTPTPVVLAESLPNEDALCQSKLAAGTATGKIVMCERGTNARIDKGFNVLAGGAAGMILYNPIQEDTESDNHWLPAIHLDGPDTALLAFVNGHTRVTATWDQGAATAATPDVMAAFSSRGPQSDFIKPDIVAPGVQVLAGMTPQPDETTPTNGPPGNNFQAIAGTSMASPHAAGVSALVMSVHPDWTPAEVKSALMTSSVQDVVKEDGSSAPTPFDDGAGSIRADRAIDPTLVFDESYADYAASASDPLHRIDLNIPSIDAPVMTGSITTTRTAINVSGMAQTLDVKVDEPDGATIVASDKQPGVKGAKPDGTVHVKKNGSVEIYISISGASLADGQYFGRITLTPETGDSSPVTIPVAFFKQQGTVSLTHTCTPTTFPAKTGVAHCLATVTNDGSAPANATLTVTNLDKGKLVFSNITAPATAIDGDAGVQWGGTLAPTVAPEITSITNVTGQGPGGGYVALSSFGPAITGVGDDTITNFNVPTFYYGGEAYSSIGVVSNGYVVLGGGTASDVNFAPQSFPDPAAPNNVVAPFWTDLNPSSTGAGSIYINVLGDGSDNWVIVDWEGVKNFSNSTTHTGEIWFRVSGGAAGTGPASEQTTISYAAGNASAGDPDETPPLTINSGAENRDGSSGANISPAPANGTEWSVNTAPPTPGGSVSIGYDASSKKAGVYRSDAAMTSDVTPGKTEVIQTLTVTGK
jgi:hypothetical protein